MRTRKPIEQIPTTKQPPRGCAFYRCAVDSGLRMFFVNSPREDELPDGSPILDGIIRGYCHSHANQVARAGYHVIDMEAL